MQAPPDGTFLQTLVIAAMKGRLWPILFDTLQRMQQDEHKLNAVTTIETLRGVSEVKDSTLLLETLRRLAALHALTGAVIAHYLVWLLQGDHLTTIRTLLIDGSGYYKLTAQNYMVVLTRASDRHGSPGMALVLERLQQGGHMMEVMDALASECVRPKFKDSARRMYAQLQRHASLIESAHQGEVSF